MTNPSPLSEDERADLVAYLDGELTGEQARALEAKLSLDPAARAEADALRRAWDLLDFLPRPEPSATFAERTVSRLAPAPTRTSPLAPRRTSWKPALWGAGWAAAVVLAGLAGYKGVQRATRHEPGEAELTRDLRVIENKRYYDLVDDLDFLRQLDHPDLFGEEVPGG